MIDLGLLRSKIINSAYDGLFTDPAFQGVFKKHGDLITIQGGGQPPKSKFSTTQLPGYIRLYQIRDYGDSPQPVYIDERECSKTTKKGDILLARYGASLGKVFIAEDGGYNVALAKVIPKVSEEHLDKKYLYYFYYSHWYRDKIFSISRSAQNGFNKEELNDIEFPLPPLEEQKRIVAKIEELFAKIDEIDKAQKELKELAELAEKKVLDMAVRGELSYARPGDSNVDDMLSVLRNKKEVGIRNGSIKLEKPYNTSREFELKPFEIPSYWRFERLGSISINLDNFRIPLKNQERQKMNNKHFPYYGASGIIDKVDDYLFDKKLLLVSEDGANLLSRSSPIAFTASGKYWVNNHAHVLDTTEEIDKDYLCCYLESISIAPYVTGSAQPKITQANLNAIWVPVPPIEEQSRIATTVSLFRAQFSTINS